MARGSDDHVSAYPKRDFVVAATKTHGDFQAGETEVVRGTLPSPTIVRRSMGVVSLGGSHTVLFTGRGNGGRYGWLLRNGSKTVVSPPSSIRRYISARFEQGGIGWSRWGCPVARWLVCGGHLAMAA